MARADRYFRFDPPIPVRIVGHGNARLPVGRCLAYGFFRSGVDDHNLWHVCMDDTGEWWEIENPYVRGDPNDSYGRTLNAQAVRAA